MVSISVIVPVYSGESFLQALTKEVERVRETWIESGAPLSLDELIFVDDSAVDNSPEMLDRIAGEKPWIRVIHLARNFGQHAATIAGILHSSGDWVVTMDEDLQHPPSEISNLLRKVAETRSDIVYGSPQDGVHGTGIGRYSYLLIILRFKSPRFQHITIQEPSFSARAALLFSAFPLAYLTWRYIETPVRRSSYWTSQRVWTASAGASVAFITFGLACREPVGRAAGPDRA